MGAAGGGRRWDCRGSLGWVIEGLDRQVRCSDDPQDPPVLGSRIVQFLSSQEHVPGQPGGSHIQTGEWSLDNREVAGRASLSQLGSDKFTQQVPLSWGAGC